jgi:rRNA maturation endonuclease Nob1
MSDDKPITIHCSNCGGQNVKADAYAEWSDESQAWELYAVFDERFCDDCGHSVSTYQREATGQ